MPSSICMDGPHGGARSGMGDAQVGTVDEVVCLWTEEC